jgi:ATP-binding cassette subfamily B protein
MGAGRAGALQMTPELLAAVDALPPADDLPDVDVAAEASRHETFRLRRFVRPYRKQLLIGFGLIVADTLVTLAGPLLVQRGLQSGVLQGSEKVLFTASALFFLTVTADWLLTWTYTRYTGRTAERLLYALRIRIFSHLQRLALDYYDREMAGRIMTRMTTDVDAFSNLLQTGIIQALVSIMSFFGVLVVLAVLSWQLTLAVMAILPPLIIATIWFRRVSSRAYPRASRRDAGSGEHLRCSSRTGVCARTRTSTRSGTPPTCTRTPGSPPRIRSFFPVMFLSTPRADRVGHGTHSCKRA